MTVAASEAKWRKIRTFKLVVGEVKGKTRADRLNEGLRRVRPCVWCVCVSSSFVLLRECV